jgi:hypothetical protein
VDTGSAGSEEIGHFRETVIEKSTTRILAYVNISAPGMGDPEQNIRTFEVDAAAGAATKHAAVVVGIKTAHYWTRDPFDAEHPPLGVGGTGGGGWRTMWNAGDGGFLASAPGTALPGPDSEEAPAGGYPHARVRPAVPGHRREREGLSIYV